MKEIRKKEVKKKNSRKTRIGKVVVRVLFLVTLLLGFGLVWGIDNFGNIGFEEIIFTLNMPLADASGSVVYGYIYRGLIPAIVVFVIIMLWEFCPVKNRYLLGITIGQKQKQIQFFPICISDKLLWIVNVAGIAVVCFGANYYYDLGNWIINQFHNSQFIEEHYVDPNDVTLSFPEKKRNLICIYVESGESSNQDKANGGLFDNNYIPEMTEIAKNNVSFSQSDLIEGAAIAPACGWTVAGLVAETSGLPLKLYEYGDNSGGADNSMKNYEAFLPGATSLGDILEKEGYKNYFLAGSNFTFGGRRNYFTQHGNYEIWDWKTAKSEGKIPKDYKVNWGFEDEKLYEFAKELLTEIASEDQPFNFSMLTVDTHQPNGYICRLCDDTYDQQYANVIACSSRQLGAFIEWLQQQSFYDNTTIVIAGDHCSMVANFYGEYSSGKHLGTAARKVYNAFVNSAVEPVKEKNRAFTTLDMFPSILASIGVQIEGERLGLGTNLFSDTDTWSEVYGYEAMFEELNQKSVFYNKELLYP